MCHLTSVLREFCSFRAFPDFLYFCFYSKISPPYGWICVRCSGAAWAKAEAAADELPLTLFLGFLLELSFNFLFLKHRFEFEFIDSIVIQL